MSFIKNLLAGFSIFKDTSIIGLCGLREKGAYSDLTISDNYKKTYIPHIQQNYLLY